MFRIQRMDFEPEVKHRVHAVLKTFSALVEESRTQFRLLFNQRIKRAGNVNLDPLETVWSGSKLSVYIGL